MDQHGDPSHNYYTCGQEHDPRNRAWERFRLLEKHCAEYGYDFYEMVDRIQEPIRRNLIWECDLLT